MVKPVILVVSVLALIVGFLGGGLLSIAKQPPQQTVTATVAEVNTSRVTFTMTVTTTVIKPSTLTITYTITSTEYHTYGIKERLESAASFLINRFNRAIGLIYESDDASQRVIKGRVYRFSQTYWLYSDNLLASWALKPFAPDVSRAINQTIHSYNLPPSGLFEVLFGTPIPKNISVASQLVIKQHPDWVVMAEFHNSSTPLLWEKYANTLIYQSLNEYLKGNRTAAENYFRRAYQMFDGKGIYDLATETDGRYANYKLALILYASRVLDYPLPHNLARSIEERLWSMQQRDGGIVSLADLDGKPVGSANTETTAMALLPYNEELIARMQSLYGAYKPTS